MLVQSRSFLTALVLPHSQSLKASGRGHKGFRSLYTYTKMDISCCEVDGLGTIMDDARLSINRILSFLLSDPRALTLAPRSWKEPHLLRYQNLPETNTRVLPCTTMALILHGTSCSPMGLITREEGHRFVLFARQSDFARVR